MWRRRILYLLVLLAALLGQILDVGYLFHFIFYATLAMPVLGLLISLPAMLGCRAELVSSAVRVPRGGEASWSLRLTNRFQLPVAHASYRMRVTNRFTGEVHQVRAVLQGMTPEEDRGWTLETDHCGLVECRVERLWLSDCLGLFALPVRSPKASELVVAPLPEHPGYIQLPEGAGAALPLPRGKMAFGETYELRPYREGDSLRMIHWKMTAKRDELVTREPWEDARPLPVLTFDHFGPLAQMDQTLDRLVGYSLALLEQERVHEVRWAHPESGAVRIYRVAGERNWEACLTAILSDPAPLRGRSILSEALAQGAGASIYQIHIHGKEEQSDGTT